MPGRSGEFERIERFFAPLTAEFPGAFGLTDDAAVMSPPAGREIVLTSDTVVAGVHFVGDEPPGLVASKLLRVNLSDLAAMGAAPIAYLLNVALPDSIDDDWLAAFTGGLRGDQDMFQVTLAGGDSVSTPGPLTLTLTAIGTVETGKALRRSRAQPGDLVYVSGTIGDGALGLLALRSGLRDLGTDHRNELIGRYRLPRPRVALGQRLVGLASAAIDISDGLAADLSHVLDASGVGAEVDAAAVPLSAAARAALADDPGLLEAILTGGDDYELLFSVPPGYAGRLAALASDLDLRLTAIGAITAGQGLRIAGADGETLEFSKKGWVHGG